MKTAFDGTKLIYTVIDNQLSIQDQTDTAKLFQFNCDTSNIPASSTRLVQAPTQSGGVMATVSGAPVINDTVVYTTANLTQWTTLGVKINLQIFTPGTSTYIPSTGMKVCFVELCGGGASGTRSFNGTATAGGGGAGYIKVFFTAAEVNNTNQPVTVGAGGSGSVVDGVSGGNSTFGTGSLAMTTTGGQAGTAGSPNAAGGTGGTVTAPSAGIILANIPGANGQRGTRYTTIQYNGAGGNCGLGMGTMGMTAISSQGPQYPRAASGYGSGGGRASSWTAEVIYGGDGAPGRCIVTEFIYL